MNDPLSPWASAAEIASAVGGGATTASAVAETTLARIAALNPELNAYTDVTAERALDEAARVDATHRQRRAHRAAGRGSLRGEEPLRRDRPAHPGRLEDQPRPPSFQSRRSPDRANVRRRRGAGRRAQHGRIRLRLHRRERARRRLPQPARPRPDERRIVLRLRGGDRGRASRRSRSGPTPTARCGCPPRSAASSASSRPTGGSPAPAPFPSSTASTISDRWRARRATPRSPTTCCRAPTPADHACADAPGRAGDARARPRRRRAPRRNPRRLVPRALAGDGAAPR